MEAGNLREAQHRSVAHSRCPNKSKGEEERHKVRLQLCAREGGDDNGGTLSSQGKNIIRSKSGARTTSQVAKSKRVRASREIENERIGSNRHIRTSRIRIDAEEGECREKNKFT